MQVYLGYKLRPFHLEMAASSSCWVHRDFCMLKVCSSNANCPSGKCASATDVASSDADIFGTKRLPLMIFHNVIFLIIKICIHNEYIFSHCKMTVVTALLEFLLFYK
jgi:hypothetical protein